MGEKMSEVRLFASHPDFQKFDFMQRMLVIATNPQMFFSSEVIAEPERLAAVEDIKGAIGEELDEYEPLPPNIAEYINKLEENIQIGELPKKVERICKNCEWWNGELEYGTGKCSEEWMGVITNNVFSPPYDFGCNQWEKNGNN